MVSQSAALLLLFAPHFLCGGILVFNTYNSCTPTASQVRITAEILCGSKTFSRTTVMESCRLSNTPSILSCLSVVMLLDLVKITDSYCNFSILSVCLHRLLTI